jgi:hypothetical protein
MGCRHGFVGIAFGSVQKRCAHCGIDHADWKEHELKQAATFPWNGGFANPP